ncbi:MAG: phosphomethylpyrimidine synthase ThiC [Planctomycetes bacterium]|nr:phosphomethylpyrimidine synthase ThiC [Planctomycetota bacterium]MBU1518145.1 phosphomethylpyrimidine synthase ThiC [Planctomycetota bacterium]MBU2457732.1 phosphomethylpyrimidine synthase ThiC [Planctomycetota bacterium]
MTTQLKSARGGIITKQMRTVAKNEGISPQTIRKETAAGKLVIPANKIHIRKNLTPIGIGRVVSIKVNANIGSSSATASTKNELKKLAAAIDAGTDTVMDLSTGGNLDKIRKKLIENCPLPFGTVPIYEMIIGRDVEDITPKIILNTIEKQAKQGVDFFTIHAGVLKQYLPFAVKRVCGIVSRGGALIAKWMSLKNRQNPFYELFEDICDIMAEYDVCFSLGDGLRPGCIADATDKAQIAELKTLGELVLRAKEKNCQVMVEGPGHIPFNQIQKNMQLQQKYCHNAPFYVLGPLVTDIAPGYDHITSAIGGTAAGFYGASFLCYVTPKEHLGLPDVEDVRQGVIAAKIAAHAADVARGHAGSAEKDRKLSIARANLDWKKHIECAIDSKTAEKFHKQACLKSTKTATDDDFCTMCGKDWCSLRINKELVKMYGKK